MFYTLDEYKEKVGSISSRLGKAKNLIQISGNDCKAVVESNSYHLDAALRRNVKVQIMCVDPDSFGALLLPLIDPRFETVSDFKDSMESVIKVLDKFRDKYPDKFEYGLLPINSPIGMFFIDPAIVPKSDEYSLIKVEIYTTKPFSSIKSRPHLIVDRENATWRQYFLNQWENFWGLCRKSIWSNSDILIHQLTSANLSSQDRERIKNSIGLKVSNWRKKLSKNQIEIVLNEIEDFSSQFSLGKIRNTVIGISAEYHNIKSKASQGLLIGDELRKRESQIVNSLLYLIELIESIGKGLSK